MSIVDKVIAALLDDKSPATMAYTEQSAAKVQMAALEDLGPERYRRGVADSGQPAEMGQMPRSAEPRRPFVANADA